MYLDRVKIQVYTQLVGQMFNAGVDFGKKNSFYLIFSPFEKKIK